MTGSFTRCCASKLVPNSCHCLSARDPRLGRVAASRRHPRRRTLQRQIVPFRTRPKTSNRPGSASPTPPGHLSTRHRIGKTCSYRSACAGHLLSVRQQRRRQRRPEPEPATDHTLGEKAPLPFTFTPFLNCHHHLKACSQLVLPLQCFETLKCPRPKPSPRRRRLIAWITANRDISSVQISVTCLLPDRPAT